MARAARPYIRSSLRINYNRSANAIDRISDDDCSNGPFIEKKLTNFLVDNGFCRRKVKKRRPPRKKVTDQADTGGIDTKNTPQTIQSASLTENAKNSAKVQLAVVGLRSVLRAISLPNPHLGAVLLDAELVNVTAVAQTFALAAFNLERCPFYVIPEMSKRLAAMLNLPRLHAIGIMTTTSTTIGASSTATELLNALRNVFRPIELMTAAAARKANQSGGANTSTTSSQFATPVLVHPKGKTKIKAKKNKK